MNTYLREAISNENRREQALIRRWWHESHKARGRMIWEYHLEDRYADGVWFLYVPDPVPDSVFVITAYRLGAKALRALWRRRRRRQ